MARKHTLEIVVDGERFLDVVTVGEVMALEGDDPGITAMAEVVSKFVFKDGAYLSLEDGLKYVQQLTMRDLKDAANSLMESAEKEAIPPTSEAESA